LLDISRSSYYYPAQVPSAEEVELLRLLDEQYMKHPTYGSRKMTHWLREQGYPVNHKRVQRLMRQLGLEAIYPKPRLRNPHPDHRVYPYLLRGVAITHVNQVWSTDMTYLPVLQGHFYLVAIMDWYSRKVLSWQVSNTLDVGFCVEALQGALLNYGRPEIFNSDQGSQFTAVAFTEVLKSAQVQISMDGRGRCHDNIFIERLWRWRSLSSGESLKYELIYLKCFESGSHLRREINGWFEWYNDERFHQSLDYKTPNQVYFK
jgi:putative transposase